MPAAAMIALVQWITHHHQDSQKQGGEEEKESFDTLIQYT